MSKLLLELLKISRIKDQSSEDGVPKEPQDGDEEGAIDDEMSLDVENEMETGEGDEMPPEDGEMPPDDEPEDGFGDEDELDQEDPNAEPEEQGDPNRAGVLRNVKGAHLVYKREQEDGTYTELWIYNSGEFKRDIATKKAILAGTDIPPNASTSPDGDQEVEVWSAGNCDLVKITGLSQ